MESSEILRKAVELGVSDIMIIAGTPISFRNNGNVGKLNDVSLSKSDTEQILKEIYQLASDRDMTDLLEKGDDDFSFAIPGLSRFRVSAFRQRGSLAAVIRLVPFDLSLDIKDSIPKEIIDLAHKNGGMVLVTGSAGCGKSTTLACIIDEINNTQAKHIITLEDPIEYLHRHRKSIITQREIAVDTENYLTALRAALRQSPDVILLGEMRDFETIKTAMTAAETGHLLLSTLHTLGAANTIDRIIDVFPPDQQRQIAVQLSMVLNAVVSQQLVPTVDNNLTPVFEIMTMTPAIRNMIREGKIPQIDGLVYSSDKPGMISMDTSLLHLCEEGRITKDTAQVYATKPELLEQKLKLLK